MRTESISIIALALVAAGCAVDLDDPAAAGPVVPEPDLVQLRGCPALLHAADAVEGRLERVQLPSGQTLFVAASLTHSGVTASATVLATDPNPCAESDAVVAAQPAIDADSLGEGVNARPQALLATDQSALAFFSAERVDPAYGFVTVGRGLARWDASSSRFVEPMLLWTGDRPSFGSGAVLHGGKVYAFGSKQARFLSADIYVARADLDRVTEVGAWEYDNGGGNWTASVDHAWPMVEGGDPVGVQWNSGLQRWMLVYAEPLGDRLLLRTGLGPSGPWSAATVLGRCDLPDGLPGLFCSDVALNRDDTLDRFVISHGIATFDRPPGATVLEFWTRWLEVDVPRGIY